MKLSSAAKKVLAVFGISMLISCAVTAWGAETVTVTGNMKLKLRPYEYNFSLPESSRGYWVCPIGWMKDFDPEEAPDKKLLSPTPRMEGYAAPDEYEPLSFVIYAQKKLKGVKVEVGSFRCDSGEIPAPELRLVERALPRGTRDGAVVKFISRFLPTPKQLQQRKWDIPANDFRQFWLTFHVPEGAEAGTYLGKIKVSPDNAESTEVEISFRVLPFKLRPLTEKGYSVYYKGRWDGLSPDIINKQLEDIRAHGCDYILWGGAIHFEKKDGEIVADFEDFVRCNRLLKEKGYKGPYRVWIVFNELRRLLAAELGLPEDVSFEELAETERFKKLTGEMFRQLEEISDREALPELMIQYMDEIMGAGLYRDYIAIAKVIRQASKLPIYTTVYIRYADEMIAMDPYVDVRCYSGWHVDHWMTWGHTLEELREEIETSGDEAWGYFNPGGGNKFPGTTERLRIQNGLWTWLSPIKIQSPWCYGFPRWRDSEDYGFGFIKGGDVLPTRPWEAFREGADDMRYIATLETLIEERSGDPAYEDARQQAEAWLGGLRKELLLLHERNVRAIAERYASAEHDDWHQKCAELIEKLSGEKIKEKADSIQHLEKLQTLIIKRRRDPAYKAAHKEAQDWFGDMWKELLSNNQGRFERLIAERYSQADYDRWRRQCAEWIEKLSD